MDKDKFMTGYTFEFRNPTWTVRMELAGKTRVTMFNQPTGRFDEKGKPLPGFVDKPDKKLPESVIKAWMEEEKG